MPALSNGCRLQLAVYQRFVRLPGRARSPVSIGLSTDCRFNALAIAWSRSCHLCYNFTCHSLHPAERLRPFLPLLLPRHMEVNSMPHLQSWLAVTRECPRRIMGELHRCGEYHHGTTPRFPGKVLCCHRNTPLPEGWQPTQAQKLASQLSTPSPHAAGVG